MVAGKSNWFHVPNDPHARLRLFCFPYAGGGASVFRTWSGKLGPQIEIAPSLLPGRETRMREPAYSQIEPIIDSLTREIIPFLNKPFAFFGHSMGGIIGFELARRLRVEHGIEPTHLFISARRAPQLLEREPRLHDLPNEELLKELKRLNGTSIELLENAELLELMLPLIRADFAVCDNYHYLPTAPLRCPISVFGGLQDEDISREKLEAWRVQTNGPCRVHMLPGDHFFIHSQQAGILRIITETLRYTQ